MQLGHLIGPQHHARFPQQSGRLLAGERQVSRADLENPALGAQPPGPQRRLGPPGQDQPGTVRDMIG